MGSINQTLPRDLDSQVGLGEHGAALCFQESRICQPCRGKEAETGAAGGEMEATPRRSLTCFWHKLFISSTLYYTRMMFPYPMPLGAVLNNRPLASGLSEGVSSGTSISQILLSNRKRTISIKSERGKKRKRKCRKNGAHCCFPAPWSSVPLSPGPDVLIDSCFHRFIHGFTQPPLLIRVPGPVPHLCSQ